MHGNDTFNTQLLLDGKWVEVFCLRWGAEVIGRQGNGLRLKVSNFCTNFRWFFCNLQLHLISDHLKTLGTWPGLGSCVCTCWTVAGHSGHLGEQQVRKVLGDNFQAKFPGQVFQGSTELRARCMCFSTPGYQMTPPTCPGEHSF